jgi:hypothetical protein
MTSPKAMRRMAGMPRGPCACVTGGGSSLPSRAGPGCRVIGAVGLHGLSMHCRGGCIHRQLPTHGARTYRIRSDGRRAAETNGRRCFGRAVDRA